MSTTDYIYFITKYISLNMVMFEIELYKPCSYMNVEHENTETGTRK